MIIRPPSPPLPAEARPMPGQGTLLTRRGTAFVYSAAPMGQSWAHPWRGSLAGAEVRLGDGRVNTLMPKIGAERMIDTVLRLGDDVQPVNGESWVCVEAKPAKEAGTLDPKQPDALLIQHRADPLSQTPEIGRQAIALIVWSGSRPVRLIQHVWFNLKYRRIQTGARVDHDFS